MITIKNVTKSYKRYQVHYNTLKSFLLNFFRYKREVKKIDTLNAIRNLNLVINPSEVFCIIGPNGAGKSTLAKLIAGTILPTEGTISVEGRIVPFLELGVAFSNELTGKDNLYLNGVLLGLSLKYLQENKEKIFAFGGLQDFIETPLKYYSSGMQLRLAFSIAMHATGDIYIFDEILAVGDASFQKKCYESFNSLLEQKKTIIIITHDLNVIKQHATQLLVLNHSKHHLISNIDEIGHIENLSDLFALYG